MAGLKERFRSQGITVEQFAFQFVVVLLGVYVAILFEGKAEDRSRAGEARAMLVTVLGELRLDERDFSQVRQDQLEAVEASQALTEILTRESPAEDAAADSILGGPLAFNPTVFPRRAAYSALVASGNMGYLSETDLALRLANLYEHHYVRLVNMGEYLDREVQEIFQPTVAARFWDRTSGRMVRSGRAANVELLNLLSQRGGAHRNYVRRLNETLQELRALKGDLQTYLDR